MGKMKLPQAKHLIRAFALVCVAVTSGYVMWMAYRVTETLSGPGWCRTALGAEKASATDGTIKGLDACVGLLTIQLKSLATNSHILFGVIALCLLVLIVIVIAGGEISFSANKSGVSANIGKDVKEAAATAAEETAQAAVDTAADIRDNVDFTIPPGDRP
jgi:hypothetical protein